MNWQIKKIKSVEGEVEAPADKSITHRSVIFGAVSEGRSVVDNFLKSGDCYSTINAFRSMGVNIAEEGNKLVIDGVGLNGLKKPADVINAGNSGTTTRLICGILAGQEFTARIIGDESLSKRPMKRIIEPLSRMGVIFSARENNFLPMEVTGTKDVKAVKYVSNIPSAQVKSSILLAGMYADGTTRFTEPVKSRDHTERMLLCRGANIRIDKLWVEISGRTRLKAMDIKVPGDISSAAFFMVLAVINKNSKLVLRNVGINPTRDGIYEVLLAMGADIKYIKTSVVSGEPVADIEVNSSKLNWTQFGADMIPRLVDEIPALVVAATQANGITRIAGAGELRVKESDRLKTIAAELNKMGAGIKEKADGLVIEGPKKLYGAQVKSYGDHRIAMSLAVAATIAEGSTQIDDVDCVDTSFPGFYKTLMSLIKE